MILHKKIVGIIGGLGPESTIELYKWIFKYTIQKGAKRDQDHLESIISIIPSTPDRDLAIIQGKNTPLNELVRSAKRLETAGSEFIVIACNAAHFFIKEIENSVNIPTLNMMKIVAEAVLRFNIEKVGLLASIGTLHGKLYDKELLKFNIEIIELDKTFQNKYVDEAIFGKDGIKEGNVFGKPIKLIELATTKFIKSGAEALIIGCTEISLIIDKINLSIPIIDSIKELAKYTVEFAYQ